MYCRPDRSDYLPNLAQQPNDAPVDIGWFEGQLSDSRPFRAEMWRQDHLTVVTFFFAMEELEHLSQTSLRNLLAKEGLVAFLGPAFVMGSAFTDAAEQALWSVSVIIAEHGKALAKERFLLNPYDSLAM